MMKGKKGVWRDVIVWLILGLLVLGIILTFFYKEFFNQDEVDRETCRQSILLRANIPSGNVDSILGLKNKFPLKCKTEVINIDDVKNPELVYKEIADAVTGVWALTGNGKNKIFPDNFIEVNVYCVPLARIQFSSEAVKYYKGLKKEGANWDGWTPEGGFGLFYQTKNVPGTSKKYNENLPINFFGLAIEETYSHSNLYSYIGLSGVKTFKMNFDRIRKMSNSQIEKGEFSLNVLPIPSEDGILFVYRTAKFGDMDKQWYEDSSWIVKYSAGLLLDGITWVGEMIQSGEENLSPEDFKKAENFKSIVAVSLKDIERIGCTDWDGIPA